MAEQKRYMVLTAVGGDRPGLVERVSSLIHLAGANLEDSRMAILGGEFALILLFSGPTRAISQVVAQGNPLASELSLKFTFHETERPTAARDYLPYSLSVTGVDRPGIVAHISSLLSSQQINVAALESGLTFAPLSGTPMFSLSARIQIPSELALPSLRADLSRLCDDENLDFLLDAEVATR